MITAVITSTNATAPTAPQAMAIGTFLFLTVSSLGSVTVSAVVVVVVIVVVIGVVVVVVGVVVVVVVVVVVAFWWLFLFYISDFFALS